MRNFEFSIQVLSIYLTGVCYLRLDFESFDINGLSDSTEWDEDANAMRVNDCIDRFTISVSFIYFHKNYQTWENAQF